MEGGSEHRAVVIIHALHISGGVEMPVPLRKGVDHQWMGVRIRTLWSGDHTRKRHHAVSRQFDELWTEAYGRQSCRYVDDFAKRTRYLQCDQDCDYDYADNHDHDYDYDLDYEYDHDHDYDFGYDNLCNMSLS